MKFSLKKRKNSLKKLEFEKLRLLDCFRFTLTGQGGAFKSQNLGIEINWLTLSNKKISRNSF